MSARERISVLIVDDHQIVRRGLRTFLELHDDVVVVGEAADGEPAVEMAGRLSPDVVLMDLMMPGMDGIEATRRIGELDVGSNVIVLTSFAGDDQVFPAIEAGAVSYLLKDVSPEDLIAAVRAAARGEPHLHPDVTRRLMEATRSRAAAGAATADGDVAGAGVPAAGVAGGDAERAGESSAGGPATASGVPSGTSPLRDDLTERELEVIRLVAAGCSNREIAQTLGISEKTVKTHVSHVLTKDLSL